MYLFAFTILKPSQNSWFKTVRIYLDLHSVGWQFVLGDASEPLTQLAHMSIVCYQVSQEAGWLALDRLIHKCEDTLAVSMEHLGSPPCGLQSFSRLAWACFCSFKE